MRKVYFLMIFTALIFSTMGEGKIFVLAFHTFLGKEKIDLDIDTNQFRQELEKLKNQGFKFVTIEDIKQNKISGDKNILITIDDGHKTVVKAYNEVLKPMNIKPILAIYPNIIGKSKSFMTWNEINGLVKEGVYIASHGYNHLKVNEKLYLKDKNIFEDEIIKSKKILEEKIGKKIDTFIYPYGVRSEITKEYLKKNGYKMAFTINWGVLKAPLEKENDMFELPRYMFAKKEWETELNIIKSKAKQ